MKRSLLLAVALILLVAPAARAEHTDPGDWFNKRWFDQGTETYCLQGFAGPLTPGEYSNMKSSTSNRINTWESQTNVSRDFQMYGGVECDNSFEFHALTCASIAVNYPGMTSRISYTPLGGSTRGETRACDLDVNGNIDFFWIAIDPEESGYNLHWDVFAPVNDGQWDYSGLLMHEFGHALGFQNHFSGSSAACTVSVGTYNTMCGNSNLGIQNFGNSNGTWWRTIESHDIGAINEVYPS
jgi:hypothetical protein